MKSTLGLALVAVCLSAVSVNAQGVVITQKETRGSQSTNTRIQMDKDHIRAESRSGNDETAFVFDGTKKVVRMVNATQKTYSEITTTEIQQMASQVSGMMAQMQAQLQSLPPEQRALVEQMMQGRGGAAMPPGVRGMPGMPAMAAAAKVEYRRTGTDKVAQWSCTKYEGSSGGQKTSEVCTVEPSALNLSPSDFGAARQLAEFMKSMMPQMADGLTLNGTADAQGYNGVPVRRTTFKNGAVDTVSEITDIRREAIPASTWDAPTGFRKEAMPGMGR